MNRRNFLLSSLGPLLGAYRAAAQSAPAMRIRQVDTVYWKSRQAASWQPHWTWVRLHAGNGLVGIGETYPRNPVEAAAIHAGVAPVLLKRDPRDIDRIWLDLYRAFDYQVSGGAEMRALSAVDLALWDLLGKSLGAPVYRLLGGRSNPRVRLYNTCFPYKYDFNREPERIMQELIETRGIRAIKIWPFDGAATRNRGQYITQQDIDQALVPVRKLRDAFGSQIDILMEFHSHWDLASAIRIAKSLEPYQPMWLEDMLLPGNFHQYRQLAEATPLPLTISERMAGRMQFAQLLEARAAKYVMFDVCWCGGISEGRKISTMAEAYQLPIAPHTAGGPLLFYATTHLTTASTNVAIQESCQVFYERDWKEFLVDPVAPQDGFISAPETPGFGMEVKPEIWQHPAAVTQSTKA
ncbi:MAG: mandelate racemase/muconate lactonizing enzyme family protein [Bryobacterales bacterium]|nr:mandelate racemase/muconate lactonizing enzyme family protein [Bryobacterales bacterium]